MEELPTSSNANEEPVEQDVITEDLRISLWNIIYPLFNANINPPIAGYNDSEWFNSFQDIVRNCWTSFFKLAGDTIPHDATVCLRDIRAKFFQLSSNNVYDFLEFLANNFDPRQANSFRESCNASFERENSVYRFVGKKIVKITSRHEIQSIECALGTPYAGVNNHIKASMRLTISFFKFLKAF